MFMSTTTQIRSTAHESIDLSAFGRTYRPPAAADTPPEVSDVLGEMPWRPARGLLYLILAFLLAVAVWAHFSRFDMVVEARGALVPEGYTRPVQAVGGGLVQFVLAREGETVARGQALLQLDTTEMRTRLLKLREELTSSREQLRQSRALKGPVAATLEQENRVARLQGEIAVAELNLKHTTVSAPVGGVLTTLDVNSPGAVIQAGQRIGAIAPDGARLVVEAQAPNKDIALIEKGLPAKLKFDAFPFQDYGVIAGAVIEVAPDAKANKEDGSFYKVLIAPERASFAANGRSLPLRPGLAVTAEIITERRSALDLIFAPFRKFKGEATGAK
jgi:multidrug efflux pump subunit AcrA (membrane-fusion protein)